MNVIIRPAKPGDFEAVYDLLRRHWPDKESNKEALMAVYLRGIESLTGEYLCAELNGSVIGFCSLCMKNSLWQEGCLAHVGEIIVDERFRGKGAGKALIKAAVDIAKKAGCGRMELDSAVHRTEAHGFYEHIGFKKRAFVFTMDLR